MASNFLEIAVIPVIQAQAGEPMWEAGASGDGRGSPGGERVFAPRASIFSLGKQRSFIACRANSGDLTPLCIKLRKPLPELIDGTITVTQDRIRLVVFIVPDFHILLDLVTNIIDITIVK